jgi:hypothetical protein
MTVSFASEGLAKAFSDHFDRTNFNVPHRGEVRLDLACTQSGAGSGSGWEVDVFPKIGADHLNGHGSATDPDEVEDIDACAKVLYDRLSRAKSRGYRFALTGFEVSDWRSVGELIDDLSPSGLLDQQRKTGHARAWDGLVVSDHVWWVAERPDGFVRFAADHMWIPFTTIAGNTRRAGGQVEGCANRSHG